MSGRAARRVGKTSLGKSVADALGSAHTSGSAMRDEAEITATYIGAVPRRIIQTLRRKPESGDLFDELSKVGADFRGDPASRLEVLDPAQNRATDHYLDLPFDICARAVHHHGELAGATSRAARPAGSHRIAELHRDGKVQDRPSAVDTRQDVKFTDSRYAGSSANTPAKPAC